MSTLVFTGVSQVVLSKGLPHLCCWGLHHKELVMFRPVKGSVKIDPQHSSTRVGLRCPRLCLVTCSLDNYVSIASDTTGTILGVETQQWERGTLPCVRSFYSLLEGGRQVLVWRLLRKAETRGESLEPEGQACWGRASWHWDTFRKVSHTLRQQYRVLEHLFDL